MKKLSLIILLVDNEWRHFTLKDEPFPDTYFTFPVEQIK